MNCANPIKKRVCVLGLGIVSSFLCSVTFAGDLPAQHSGNDLRYPKCLEVTVIDDCARARITGACFKIANSCGYEVRNLISYPQNGRTRYEYLRAEKGEAGGPPVGFLMPARNGGNPVIFHGGCDVSDKECLKWLEDKARR